MKHSLPYWKARAIDLEELIFLETDRETLKILLMGYVEAIMEIEACVGIAILLLVVKFLMEM